VAFTASHAVELSTASVAIEHYKVQNGYKLQSESKK